MSDTQASPARGPHLDMAGKPILAGSLIVYATSQQSSGCMKCGIVAELQWRSTERWVGGASRANGGDGHHEPYLQPKLSVITAELGIERRQRLVDVHLWLARRDDPDRGTGDYEPVWHIQRRGAPVMLDRLEEVLVVDASALAADVVTMLREALAKRSVNNRG